MGIGDVMERLKKKIHGSKIPLSLRGQRMMAVIYMVGPIVGGTMVMKWAMGKEENNRVSWSDHQRSAGRLERADATHEIASVCALLAGGAQISRCGWEGQATQWRLRRRLQEASSAAKAATHFEAATSEA